MSSIISYFASQANTTQNPFLESILTYVPPDCFKDLGCVGPLMRIGADVNVYDVNGTTPLHKAISAKSEAVFNALVAANANISALTKDLQFSPLSLATVQNCTNLVEKLLNAGANPNIPNAVGQTPIFFAQDPRAAQLLVDKGANVNITSQLGISPLLAAISTNSSAIVDVLVKAGADLNYVGPYPKSYTFESIRCYNSDGATGCVFNGGTPLVFAIFERNPQIITQLIKAGADVNHVDARHTHRTPLIAALLTENLAVVNSVLNAGADIKYINNERKILPPIVIAILTGNAEMVERLIGAGADVNVAIEESKGGLFSPLGKAITHPHGDQKIVELLLDAGATLIHAEMTDKCNLPLYHYDIEENKAKTIEHYLELGHEPFNQRHDPSNYEDWLRLRREAGKLT